MATNPNCGVMNPGGHPVTCVANAAIAAPSTGTAFKLVAASDKEIRVALATDPTDLVFGVLALDPGGAVAAGDRLTIQPFGLLLKYRAGATIAIGDRLAAAADSRFDPNTNAGDATPLMALNVVTDGQVGMALVAYPFYAVT